MQTKKYTKSQLIALNGLFAALIFLFILFPVQIGPVSLAVIPIIAVILSAETVGPLNGMLAGLFFGLLSLLSALIRPQLLSFAFYNPLVSVLPRVLIGISAYGTVRGLQKLFPHLPEFIRRGLGALAGVLTNTVGVLGMIYLFYHGTALSNGTSLTFGWILGIVVSNSVLEAVVCTVVIPPLSLATEKAASLMRR